ncbi:MAG: TetR/AcrR family transcriptional regulator [Chloroflexi bacterium]|nr:TetR/AcrR family transcriptional regulator [Chloroflexota bacterium]MCI0578131.1 TetR/AcrR family transcriptional regulator [Chloroflexota bacterium]MCI0649623.1 TetR/AcrR family transcriptional regulator [Chloroflexota bacterium]MCI0727916.1 TetR/AcrR family transcriptional regulator [Chloroflexota bacterium]
MTESTLSKGERTRAGLIEAAFELFAGQGFHGTSMRQIAERAGLTVGSIYNHFPSKDDIFVAVVQEYHPLTRIAPLLAEIEGDDVEELIGRLARQLIGPLEETPGLLNLALVEFVELEGKHLPRLIETFQPQVMAFVQRLAVAQGQLRPAPLLAIFRAFVGLILGYILTAEALKAWPAGPDQLGRLDDFIDLYLRGVLKM